MLPDFALPPFSCQTGDIGGELDIPLPCILTKPSVYATLIPIILRIEPTRWSDLDLTLRVAEGHRLGGEVVAVWGRFPQHQQAITSAYALRRCPFDSEQVTLWFGGEPHIQFPGADLGYSIGLAPDTTGSSTTLRIPSWSSSNPPHPGWRLTTWDGVNQLDSGDGVIHAVAIWLRPQIGASPAAADAPLALEVLSGGAVVCRKTLVVLARSETEVDHACAYWKGPISGAATSLFDGQVRYNLPLFAALGPGLPVNLDLAYDSGSAAALASPQPGSTVDTRAELPFGPGWSSLLTSRLFLLTREREVRTGDTDVASPRVTIRDILFLDSDGRLTWFLPDPGSNHDALYLRPPDAIGGFWTTAARTQSGALSCTFDSAAIYEVADGYRLLSADSLIELDFDRNGRPRQLRRMDHARPLLFDYALSGDRVLRTEITDSQGRATSLVHGTDGRVSEAVDPSGSHWVFEYNGRILATVRHAQSGATWRFACDDSGRLLELTGPASRASYIWQPARALAPRRPLMSVTRVIEGNYAAAFAWDFQSFPNTTAFEVAVQEPEGRVSRFRYASVSLVWTWEVDRGAGHREIYDGAGWQSFVPGQPYIHRSGYSTTYPNGTSDLRFTGTIEGRRRLVSISSRNGATTRFTYGTTANGAVVVTQIVEDEPSPGAGHPTWLFQHNDDGELVSETDPSSVRTSHVRSTEPGKIGLVTRSTRGPTWSEEQEHDAMGCPSLTRDGEGNETAYERDGLGRMTRSLDSDGEETRFRYDPATLLVSEIETAAGIVIRRTYSALGQMEHEIDLNDGEKRIEYNDLYEPTSEIFEGGAERVRYNYDIAGRLLEVTEESGSRRETTTNVYDALGNIAQATVTVGGEPPQVTTITYTDEGQIARLTHPPTVVAGQSFTPTLAYAYRLDGLLESETADIAPGRQQRLTYRYDRLARVVQIDKGEPGAEISSERFLYDAAGVLIQHSGDNLNLLLTPTVPRASTTSLELDQAGLPHRIRQNGRTIVEVERDGAARTTQVRMPNQSGQLVSVEKRQYQGFRLSAVETAYGHATQIRYDEAGRPATLIDPLGTRTLLQYDAADRLIRMRIEGHDGSLAETRYAWGIPHDELLEISQFRGGSWDTTRLQYEDGLLTSVTTPIGATWRYTYDATGNLATLVDPSGVTRTFSSNDAGTESAVAWSSGPTVRTERDLAGRLLSSSDGTALKTLARNGVGLPTRINYSNAAAGFNATADISYDGYGRVASVMDDLGFFVVWDHDGFDRISRVTVAGGAGPPTVVAQYDRDLQGRPKRVNRFGLEDVYQWGNASELLSIRSFDASSNLVRHVTYDYDVLERLTAATHRHLSIVERWRYDGVGRLTGHVVESTNGNRLWEKEWTYDEAGNAVVERSGGIVTTRTYNGFNQLIGSRTFGWTPLPPASLTALSDSALPGHAPDLASDGLAAADLSAGHGFVSETTTSEHWLELVLPSRQAVSGLQLALPHGRDFPAELRLEFADTDGVWHSLNVLYAVGAGILDAPSGRIRPAAPTATLGVAPAQAARIRLLQPADAGPRPPAEHPYALAVAELTLFSPTEEQLDCHYDACGRLLEDGEFTYQYDAQGRLAEVIKGTASVAHLEYGPDGELVVERDPVTGAAVFNLALAGRWHSRRDAVTGAPISVAVFGESNRVLATADASGVKSQFETNKVGTVETALDPGGAKSLLTGPWGEAIPGISPNDASTPRFGGYQTVADGSLAVLPHRAYSVALNRFLSPDDPGMPDLPNLYTYAGNDPVNAADSGGEFITHLLGGIASVGIGYAIARVQGKDYELSDAAVDFCVGAASSGLSSLGKCAKLGAALNAMSQGGRVARVAARAAPVAGAAALGVGGDYATAVAKGEADDFDLTSSLLTNTLMGAIGGLFVRAYCFAPDVLVSTPAGRRPIGDLEPGDMVLARTADGLCELVAEVGKVARRFAEETVAITFGTDPGTSQSVVSSKDHLWYAANRGWLRAAELREGDILVTATDEEIAVIDVRSQRTGTELVTLELDKGHTFFVSASSSGAAVWVHNGCHVRDALMASDVHLSNQISWRRLHGVHTRRHVNRHAFATLLFEQGRGTSRRFISRNRWRSAHRIMWDRKVKPHRLYYKTGVNDLGINAATRSHAEGGVFNQLAHYLDELKAKGATGKRRAVLLVDKRLCSYCESAAGVRRMFERAELDELVIIWRHPLSGKSGLLLMNEGGLVDNAAAAMGDWVAKLLRQDFAPIDWSNLAMKAPVLAPRLAGK
ncbi:RHS repeat-associated core domain-containing protein [Mesorhizobium sp. KR9-304]|uniref:RHS repeat-associated core domain-containing protein n=1 Tax=Mesorhizobium sp. KR9-304 TaxID=3156614 RepID=UPI0032B43396